EADGFIGGASIFIDSVITETKAAYDATIDADPFQAQRRFNLLTAQTKTTDKLASAKLHIVPRFFNNGVVNYSGLQVSMFRGTQGPGVNVKSARVDLAEAEQRFFDYTTDVLPASSDDISDEDRNLLDLERSETSRRKPMFVLGNGDPGNPPIDLD